ncbi:MAG: acyl-CoA thioesterase domain-containing protein [Acidimicrobiales bacterium]
MIFDQFVEMRHDVRVVGSAASALDELLAALDLRPDGDDRFAVESSGASAARVFGGRLLAQAVAGAAATVVGKEIHSLHASFVRSGTPGAQVKVDVTRLRDGRSVSTREVAVLEGGEPVLVAIASFGTFRDHPEFTAAAPAGPPPEAAPPLEKWAAAAASDRHWVERPLAVEMRLPEAPSFMSGMTSTSARSHWMRLPRNVGESHSLHAALLAYASDFFLMDMIFRAHPEELGPGRANGFSLDHSIWFHRPVRFDGWLRHTQEAVALVGDRGLARGAIHDSAGRLIASVAQEVLLRLGDSG